MLFVLSPAKSLDFATPAAQVAATPPLFLKQAAELIAILKKKSPQEVASLMTLSDKLAGLNVARYQAWRAHPGADATKPALLAFNGDVYDGLDAKRLDGAALAWAQDHLCILSGLYGVLRPLDALQPYRLEMGTRLANAHGDDLYAFWGRRIADYLQTRLAADATPVLVNLASQEYFKAVAPKALKARVVDCVFEDFKGGQYKTISFYAKRARGLMARFAVTQRLRLPEQLKAFDLDGYAFVPAASRLDRLVFRRRLAV